MKTVHIYDMQTGQSREIPARELAPGYVKVTCNESGEELFVRSENLRRQSYQHPPFTGALRRLMGDFAAMFEDVIPQTPAQWEDNFRRDLDVDREIAVWLKIAGAYKHLIHGETWSTAARGDILRIIVLYSCNGLDAGLDAVKLKSLSRDQAVNIRERLRVWCGQ